MNVLSWRELLEALRYRIAKRLRQIVVSAVIGQHEGQLVKSGPVGIH